MVPNSPSFAPLSSPLLKAGAEGAVHNCGRGNAPPLQTDCDIYIPTVGEGLCPSRRFCKNRIDAGNMHMWMGKPCPPRLRGGVPPNGGGGEQNMAPNSPSFASLSSPLLKAGAKGAV